MVHRAKENYKIANPKTMTTTMRTPNGQTLIAECGETS